MQEIPHVTRLAIEEIKPLPPERRTWSHTPVGFAAVAFGFIRLGAGPVPYERP
jgi:hypothetical protein